MLEAYGRMPKRPKIPVQIRLPRDLVQRLDAYAVEMRRSHPEKLWTRSEVVRAFIEAGLERKR